MSYSWVTYTEFGVDIEFTYQIQVCYFFKVNKVECMNCWHKNILLISELIIFWLIMSTMDLEIPFVRINVNFTNNT